MQVGNRAARPPPLQAEGPWQLVKVRRGDAISIPGDYQARALRHGPAVQRFWHASKLALVDRWLPVGAARVLDVGCGSGVVAERLAATAARVDAVDANPDAIAYARSASRLPNLHFHLSLVEELPFEEDCFDYITCLELIEHLYLEQGLALVSRLGRMLRPGGRLLLSTPNTMSLWPAIEFLMDRLSLAPRMKGDQHVSRYTLGRLMRLGRSAELECVKVGRFCGIAPFAAAFSWRLAERVDRGEASLGAPLGNLLFAVWTKS